MVKKREKESLIDRKVKAYVICRAKKCDLAYDKSRSLLPFVPRTIRSDNIRAVLEKVELEFLMDCRANISMPNYHA